MALERVEIRRAMSDEFYFVHVAANGEDLETSEMYVSLSNAHRGAKTAHPTLPLKILGDDEEDTLPAPHDL